MDKIPPTNNPSKSAPANHKISRNICEEISEPSIALETMNIPVKKTTQIDIAFLFSERTKPNALNPIPEIKKVGQKINQYLLI